MNPIATPTILIIVGISGDLACRKLLPAIRRISEAGILPHRFRIVGITRRELVIDDVLPDGDNAFLRSSLDLFQMDLDDPAAYARLSAHLDVVETELGAPAQRLFYLSVPPNAAHDIIDLLGASGISKKPNTKLLLEKPFGTDLASAEKLIDNIDAHFDESRVYRIDHYLAKEMAQNLVVFRSGNSLFKRTWNRDFIEAIDIVASEEIGIDGRAAFYEQTGALRDVIQSHLLQLAALTLMELPPLGEWYTIPQRRLQALHALMPPADVRNQVVRGQYAGYATEAGNPLSRVETFVAMTLFSGDPRWEGVPITLATGKMLHKKETEIRIHYRREHAGEANTLALRIQPNEGVEFCLWAKNPGYDRELRQLPLDFSYSNHFPSALPEAYERVFVDAMRSDRALFASGDEVLASWRILQPILDHWNAADDDIVAYSPGSEAAMVKKRSTVLSMTA